MRSRVAGGFSLLVLAAVSFFIVERNPLGAVWLTNDSTHPDSLFLQKAITRSGVSEERRVDLSGMNGGDWRIACIVGGYQDAASVLREFAPNDPATTWWKLIWPWLYAGSVPESAMALIYVTSDAVRVRRFISPSGSEEHVKACAMSPNRELIWR